MPHSGLVVTGARGQLGTALRALAPEAVALGRRDLDLADAAAVDAHPALAGARVVVNCAAHTAVDAAESDPDPEWSANRDAPANLARRCAEEGAHLIHVSTDYVFGSAAPRRPLRPDDATAPDTVYGASKLAGERAVLASGAAATIVRTAWVWTGPRWPGGDFATTMLRLAAERDRLDVVDDQHGSPTWAPHLAAGLLELAADPVPGVLHAAGGGAATWCDLAREVLAAAGHDPAKVHPCTTADFPRPAPRPPWSVLDCSSWADAGLAPLPEWRAGVAAALS
ncbi:dTDP-4-dehydrorhamnose reductase [Corynebacterium sp. 335C]